MVRFLEDVEIIGNSLILKERTTFPPISPPTPEDAVPLLLPEKVRVRIQAEDDNVTIFDGDGKPALSFNSRWGVLDVGGKDVDPGIFQKAVEGDIRVHDGQGTVRVHIDGSTGGISLDNRAGRPGVHISGEDGAVMVNSTLAVQFNIAEWSIDEPGTVMVVDDVGNITHCGPDSGLIQRAIGILLGVPPGIERDQFSRLLRPVAVAGKTFCKFDPRFDAGADIKPGNFLAISPTPGKAKRANDFDHSQHMIIGKALGFPTPDGTIEVLLSLS